MPMWMQNITETTQHFILELVFLLAVNEGMDLSANHLK